MAVGVEMQLSALCAAAGAQEGVVLAMLARILGNLLDNPKESKFRRLNPNSDKLKNELLCYAGALELLTSIGFRQSPDGFLELPVGEAPAATMALAAVRQHCGGGQGYATATRGSGGIQAYDVLAQVARSEGGDEVLKLLERILDNIRRYPNNDKYRCINLSKASGQKVMPAIELLRVAGFERISTPEGEDVLQLGRPNVDILERVWAMVWWAGRGHSALSELPAEGTAAAAALGACLGAAAGDALGAPLGGQEPMAVNAFEVDKALEMCGGGLWTVAPGQVTGHTELLLCLAEALADAEGSVFPCEDVAVRYGRWGKTHPFRADRACLQVFHRPMPPDKMTERAREVNQKSLSSGALVRCAAVAVMGAALKSPEKAAALANEDARLSHPSRVIAHANSALAFTIAMLIGGTSGTVAVEELERWMKRQQERIRTGVPKPGDGPRGQGFTHISAGGEEADAWSPPGEELVACEEVIRWVRKAKGSEPLPFSDMSVKKTLVSKVHTCLEEDPDVERARSLKKLCDLLMFFDTGTSLGRHLIDAENIHAPAGGANFRRKNVALNIKAQIEEHCGMKFPRSGQLLAMVRLFVVMCLSSPRRRWYPAKKGLRMQLFVFLTATMMSLTIGLQVVFLMLMYIRTRGCELSQHHRIVLPVAKTRAKALENQVMKLLTQLLSPHIWVTE
ncbi:ADP-ribosyl-[dinitrogen reductase] glycohydrolase [Symbiodinium microadriaticum]|uniref:ADP-ribosyl-[dinitrogen reductase] glycohydrolase n=1 Tax=Symbiodinium microadriaticum TaxID=2951 RepID=A0A1Q9CD62_SYMMI|nr:ADP-ribosyl-[dinitrogen reductase] glycohydrolase [Symbiodinium microadriaticum]